MIRFFHVAIVAIALFGAFSGQAGAQGAFGGGKANITAQLVAESDVAAPGSKVSLAFVMTPAPGWHGYWENPGDAGKGMATRWSLPAGGAVGALRYPVPQTLLISGLMNHVYEGRYAVLADFTVPQDAKPGARLPIRVAAEWLACTDSICVPESGNLALDLIVGNGGAAAQRADFDRARAALPQPLGGTALFEAKGDLLRIAVPFPASARAEQPYFFRLTEGAKSYATPQSVSRDGNTLVIEIGRDSAEAVPAKLEGVLRIGEGRGLAVAATPGPVPAPSSAAATDTRTIALALIGALFGGLLLNIMPCVFPILSLKAISLAKAGGDARAAKREALAYAAGVVLTCLALGALLLGLRAGGMSVGWAFQLQSPAVILLLVLVSGAITLNLGGGFTLAPIDAGDTLTRKGGAHGAFWTGALVAFVATPCTGPFMAAALGAALVLPTLAALAIFVGLGLGLALPFLAIAYVPAIRRAMPKPGAWMKTFQRLLAIPMALTTLALLWLVWRQVGVSGLVIACALLGVTSAALLGFGFAQRRAGAMLTGIGAIVLIALAGAWAVAVRMLPAAQVSALASGDVRFSEANLAKARASGKPVFLYFTADWCLSCKVNEAAAIGRAEVRDAFAKADVIVMVGDWTNADPAIGRFLERQGRSGVPLYLWYAPGKAAPQELPQILTPALLTGLAR